MQGNGLLIKDIALGCQSIECTLLCVLPERGGVQETARVVRDENKTSVGRRVTRNHAVTDPQMLKITKPTLRVSESQFIPCRVFMMSVLCAYFIYRYRFVTASGCNPSNDGEAELVRSIALREKAPPKTRGTSTRLSCLVEFSRVFRPPIFPRIFFGG